MNMRIRKLSCLLLTVFVILLFAGCSELKDAIDTAGEIYDAIDMTDAQEQSDAPGQEGESGQTERPEAQVQNSGIDEDGAYTSKDDVALYIHTYGRLPDNFVTKSQARKKGWEGGSVEEYFPGCSIGGDKFGNYEGLLPQADGRTYSECDIDTLGASSRGAKRIVFSNDGLIYYTDDHYESFTLLYGEE